ncbi:ketopantoate reductase family protein [Streptomyces sp. NPDC002643]
MANERLTVAVLGPGGVGGLLAALLARTGHRVICVAGEETAEALARGGIRVRSSRFGDFTAPVETATELREPVDAALIAVKHTTLAPALDRLPAKSLASAADTLVVPFLNGVEHPAALRAHYGESAHIAPATIRVESTRVAPGVIEHGSPFAEVDLTGDTAPLERLNSLAGALEWSGVTTRVLADETAVLWTKLVFLAPFALLTTRHGLTLGEVRIRHREELTALVEEMSAVSAAVGAPVDPAESLRRYDAFPPATKSSMQRDAEAARPLELDAIGGALLRAADRHDVPVPVAKQVIEALRAVGH